MASEAPAWLTDSNETPATSSTTPSPTRTPTVDTGAGAATPTNSARAGRANTSVQEERDLPQIILMMRLANMGVAAAVIASSIILIVSFPPLSSLILAVYAVCGGLLICCLETQLKFLRVIIAVNFGFLFHSVWRFIFYLILASVCWSYNKLYGQAVGIALAVVAFFNTYILCRYPAYRQMRERIAEEEDKRIEARMSKEVKRQAVNQVVGTAMGNNNNNTNMSGGI